MKEILLIFLLWITQGHTECPVSCSCNPTSVLCMNKELETLPVLDDLETSPAILDFSGNSFLFVCKEDFTFIKSDEVKEVYLNNSEIAEIGRGAFDKLENLQELYLGQNYLSGISESIIEELDGMVLLDLSNNYFIGDMPIIRSNSLEVLVLANSKISSIPQKSLKHLPNLKLLLLQQNNIQTLTTDVFDKYGLNSLFIKLSFNSWKCNCDNIKTFDFLDQNNFIDRLEPYQCIFESNEMINIFGSNGALETMSQQCLANSLDNEVLPNFKGYHEGLAMIDGKRGLKHLSSNEENSITTEVNDIQNDEDYKDKELDIKKMNDEDLETVMSGTCWERFTNAYANGNLFTVILVATISSFVTGFVSGVVFCKVLYIFRYKKLEQSSDSQVQLLRP